MIIHFNVVYFSKVERGSGGKQSSIKDHEAWTMMGREMISIFGTVASEKCSVLHSCY